MKCLSRWTTVLQPSTGIRQFLLALRPTQIGFAFRTRESFDSAFPVELCPANRMRDAITFPPQPLRRGFGSKRSDRNGQFRPRTACGRRVGACLEREAGGCDLTTNSLDILGPVGESLGLRRPRKRGSYPARNSLSVQRHGTLGGVMPLADPKE